MLSSPEDRFPPAEEQRSADLLSRFARGDDDALGELVDRETPRILRRLRARMPRDLKARMGASDILQLTAADLVKLRGRFENLGVAAFRELVATIADRTMARAIKRERAEKRTPAKEARVSPADSGNPFDQLGAADSPTPSRTHGRTETVRKLQGCLARLSEQDRTVLRLLDYDELSCVEAAQHLGISVSAVQQRHSRAVARLGKLMHRRPTGSENR